MGHSDLFKAEKIETERQVAYAEEKVCGCQRFIHRFFCCGSLLDHNEIRKIINFTLFVWRQLRRKQSSSMSVSGMVV